MKRFLAAALSLLLILSLAACGKTPRQPDTARQPDVSGQQDAGQQPGEQFVFTRENFPRLNGSTAMVPL